MPTSHSLMRQPVFLASVVAFVVGAVCLVGASPQRKSIREEMMLEGAPVIVSYSPSASPRDLALPFSPGARVERSFFYRVTTKNGKRITYYASAVLISPSPAERVIQEYSRKLPGRPRAEFISDKTGKRHVLSVASAAEVRRVTIRSQGKGCRIELVRALGKTLPPKLLRPKGKNEKVA